MVCTASLLGALQLKGGCEIQAEKFACSVLGKALNGMPPPLFGRQVAQFSLRREGWWQEGHPTAKQMPCNTKCRSEIICCGDL